MSDGDVPVVWHEPRRSSGRAGKSIEVRDEVLGLVGTNEFLHFIPGGFKLGSEHGSRYAL